MDSCLAKAIRHPHHLSLMTLAALLSSITSIIIVIGAIINHLSRHLSSVSISTAVNHAFVVRIVAVRAVVLGT